MTESKKDWGSTSMDALATLGMSIFWVLSTFFKIVVTVASGAVWALDLMLPERKTSLAVMKKMPRSNFERGPIHRDFESTVVVEARPQQLEDYKTADRIVAIRLDPPVAVLHLRVYYAQKLIKREMIVTEQRLRGLLQGRRHTLSDAVYDSEKGLNEVKDETVRLAEALINARGNTSVKPLRQVQEVKEAPKQEPKAVAKVESMTKPRIEAKPAPEVKMQPAQKVNFEQPAKTKSFVPRPTPGVTFEGILSASEMRTMTPEGRAKYETFEAKVRLENGVDVPLRGVELERELERCHVKLGDRVAITPMGKVPVTLPSGAEGEKNMYRVVRLEGRTQ